MALTAEMPRPLIAESQTDAFNQAPLHEGRIFHALRKIHAFDDIYPFTLRGEEYLTSDWKRGMDLVLGSLAMIPAAPIVAGATLLTKIESPYLPAIITQQRYGREWNLFGMLKIRSMRDNYEATGDIAPTRVGRVLRITSIDELPQLINVLFGYMSLVGRRPIIDQSLRNIYELMRGHLPYIRARRRFGFTDEEWRSGELPEETKREIREYADLVREKTLMRFSQFIERNTGRPGITGLYQVLGRRIVPEHQRVRLDIFYEQHTSLGLDLAILAGTLPAVVSRSGAF
ncbi:sugar transferase [Candidatus Gottesmanbacteria bacterium]|nr:sugar transferase [Candidatus Gottesmanbacteria bacterium]